MPFSCPDLEKLNRRIEHLRDLLHTRMDRIEDGTDELLKLSQELDKVIHEFHTLRGELLTSRRGRNL